MVTDDGVDSTVLGECHPSSEVLGEFLPIESGGGDGERDEGDEAFHMSLDFRLMLGKSFNKEGNKNSNDSTNNKLDVDIINITPVSVNTKSGVNFFNLTKIEDEIGPEDNSPSKGNDTTSKNDGINDFDFLIHNV